MTGATGCGSSAGTDPIGDADGSRLARPELARATGHLDPLYGHRNDKGEEHKRGEDLRQCETGLETLSAP